MIKIGLLGCGVVASYGHLPAIVNVPGLSLTAVYDPNAERARQAAEKFGAAQWFTNPDAFFASGIDAISVTSAAPFHKENILDAARYGKHAICEKPLALEDSDAREMIEAMRSAGLMLFTGFCYRFSPSALKIKELIAAGAIGAPKSLRLIYDWDCHGKYERDQPGPLKINERRAGRMYEGGPMIDCGTHQIDLARWWMGDVVQSTGIGAWVDNYEAPDHIYMHMDHACGAHTLVEISYSHGYTAKEPRSEFVYEIVGADGVIRYDRNAQSFDIRTAAGTQTLEWHHEKNFEEMYRAFAHALETGDPGHLPSGEDGLLATVLARRGTQEAIERRPPHKG
ncbi:MAG: Gfo/Idh/MocA family oxidoreductase [Capsulimonadaceae bacterium]|nr:Gfo/Idh/MocA family oxidoreductase [Capsulimonadaceae bacterium]